MTPRLRYIFGGDDRPWDESSFTAVDDRVRGGASVSHLTVSPSPSSPCPSGGSPDSDRGGADAGTDTGTGTAATFHGHLDTKALDGAGFASQRTVDPFLCDLRGAEALVMEVVLPLPEGDDGGGLEPEGDGKEEEKRRKKTFTLTLKDTILPRHPDGREQSTVSWESDFSAGGCCQDEGVGREAEDVANVDDTTRGAKTREITMPLAGFRPTYRGKPVEDGSVRLDLASVKRISIMMRSFFGEQEGNFSLTMNWVAARMGVSNNATGAV